MGTFSIIKVQPGGYQLDYQKQPTNSPKRIVQIIKSITAREIFRRVPTVKKQLWGGHFWTSGYYISTVGAYADETTLRKYVEKQGQEEEYEQLHYRQLHLFEL